jgi:hypothetical protein
LSQYGAWLPHQTIVAPHWLDIVSWISVALGVFCAIVIVVDETRHPQMMWIMNLVWPLTALYASVLGLWAYFALGRTMRKQVREGQPKQSHSDAASGGLTWKQVTVSATHCGAGCALGDIVGENLVHAAGWKLWGEMLYADYLVTLVLAWVFGIAFQYFNIKPMKHLSAGQALLKSIQADTLTVLFFQIGMYAWMALVYFVLFPNPHLHPHSPTFWFMMQVAMLLGFLTSYPVNEWLLRKGIKEAMG